MVLEQTSLRPGRQAANGTDSSPARKSRASVIRLVVCGSVDDGKSTLIGYLLATTGSIPSDQIDGARIGHRPGSPIPDGQVDYSLLTDGLEAERQQGITIDAAYRHMMLPSGRRLIVADAPGHEQYTRNMAVAASSADIALLLVDAVVGIRPQTRRHLAICALMGVRALVVVVNKMDAVNFDAVRFRHLADRVTDEAAQWGITDVLAIPVSATLGVNIAVPSPSTPYYSGPTVLEALDQLPTPYLSADHSGPLRFPVQHVVRHEAFRGCAGTIAAGSVRVGESIVIAQHGSKAIVTSIHGPKGPVKRAVAGDPVVLRLDPDVDAARGDIFIAANDDTRPTIGLAATLVWVGEDPLAHGRSYLLICEGQTVPATVTKVRHLLDLDTGSGIAARRLSLNEIGDVEISTDRPVLVDPYLESGNTGAFVLVDRVTCQTVAAGLVRAVLKRTSNVTPHTYAMDRAARARIKQQRPVVVWLTGLSGAGKSTIADMLERRLHSNGLHTYVLDGDNLRVGLTKDLGFSPEDRAENVRRVSETARLMLDAGLVVIVALVSPFLADRLAARERFEPGDFVEVWVDTPLEVCRQRDAKGLYAQSADGELGNLTGVGQRYEAPEHAEVRLDGTRALDRIVGDLEQVVLQRTML